MAISELSQSPASAIAAAAQGMSPDLSRLNDIVIESAPDEEVKGQDAHVENDDFEVDKYSDIKETMPFTYSSSTQFDSLADLINRMSSFDPSLFKRLLEIVLNELRPANEHEVKVF